MSGFRPSAIKKRHLLLLILLALFSFSCSFDYEEATVEEELSEEIPDTVMLKFSQTVVEEDGSMIRLEAEKAEVYEKQEKMIALGISFQEFNEAGELITEGKAEKAVYYTDTENAEFSGSILFFLPQEDSTLTAEAISWEDETRRLTTPPGVSVQLQRKDGSFISGQDLVADLRSMIVEFGKAVSGRIVVSEENTSTDESAKE
jgi:LPS export ABC transporter protein LptC